MLKTPPKVARSGPKPTSLSETTLSDTVEPLPRTWVNKLSSDAPGARELRILYDPQLPQVTFGALEHYVSLGTVFCNALMVKTLP
jgi:hypothetical protein